MHRWLFQAKSNLDCTKGNNKGSSALNLISASSLFISRSPATTTEDFICVVSVPSISWLLKLQFPSHITWTCSQTGHRKKDSLGLAQVQGAGNNFCASPGYYLLGRNTKLTLNGKEFVVFIFLFCLLFTFVSQLYPSSGVPGVFTIAWDARFWKIKVPGCSFHIFCLLRRAGGVFPSTTRNPKQIPHSREISALQHSQGFHFKQTNCSSVSEGFAQSLKSMHSWTACD